MILRIYRTIIHGVVMSLEADSFGRLYSLPLLQQVHVVSSNRQVVWVSSYSRKRHFICMSMWSEMDEIEYEENRCKLKMHVLWLVYTNQTDGKCRKMINSSFMKIPVSTLLQKIGKAIFQENANGNRIFILIGSCFWLIPTYDYMLFVNYVI